MNAYMNINVRVMSAQAQAQIKALQARVAGLETQLRATSRASAGSSILGGVAQRKSMAAWGNQIQWTGRQLQYNWTIPLLLAGGAATKFAMDNEKAFTHIKKVYGDSADAAAQFNKEAGKSADAMYGQRKAAQVFNDELDALQKSFVVLSNRYGVAQKDVLETASAWAAAGQSGVALAKSTELSIKASVLGDMDLAKATDALISIQSQYSENTKELGLTLAELNAIENQTGISMQGLIDGFGRAAGVARESGVDVRHLGAMLAALVPATGSAATAGNAIKTIISRIMSPTEDASAVMKQFGVDVSDATWQSSTAMERLNIIADHMNGTLQKSADGGYKLSDSQKQVVASVLGSRYQMNRFLVLMRELGPEYSYYEKALNATADRTKVFSQASKELNAVLQSNPQRLKIIWTTLQNGMATSIQPLIPYIIYLAQEIANMVNGFANLNPVIQKTALMFLVLLASVGPITKYFGSLLTLIATMGIPLKFLAAGLMRVFFTTTVVSNGLLVTRASLVSLMISTLTFPFRMLLSGFGAVAVAIWNLAKTIKLTEMIALAWRSVMAALPAVIVAGYAVAATAVQAVWAGAMRGMIAIQTVGVAGIVRSWLVGIAYMTRAATFGPLLRTLTLALGLMQAAIVAFFAGLGPMLLRLGFAIDMAWAKIWSVAATLFETFQLAMLSLMTVLRNTLFAGWTGIYLGITAITTAGSAAVLRIWEAFQVGWMTLTVAFRAAMLRVWAGIMLAWEAITTVGARGVMRIFTSGVLVLPRIIAMAGVGIAASWGAIMTAIRAISLRAIPAMFGPWGIAISLIITAIIAFRTQLIQIWHNAVAYFSDSTNAMTQLVIRAWNSLPSAVSNALVAVARVVQQAALAIYHWFSYINPFAHHSPSLVENVTKGTAIVASQFHGMSQSIKSDISSAYSAIKTFGRATSNLIGRSNSYQEHQQRQKIAKYDPRALASFDKLSMKLRQLQKDLAYYQNQENRQQSIVDRWQRSVDQASAALDRQQKKLEALQKVESKWQDKLSAAQDTLDKFANAPIKGMQKMSDKIFENDQAQKALQLQMMKMEDVTGPLDDIKSKMDAINGAQEMLRGDQAALRSAGAGSEILSFYDDQIKALDQQRTAQTGAAQALQDMNDQLDALQRKGQELDLENSLKFDPLTRQIEQAANAMKELPFDVIMAGVQGAQADMKKYQHRLDDASAAVGRQQKIVDQLTARRDKLQASLDAENNKLQKIKDNYDQVAQAIQDVQKAMSDAASAADTLDQKAQAAADKRKKLADKQKGAAAGYVSPALQNFLDAKGGNFPVGGGQGIPIRKNWQDQSAQIQKFTDKISNQAANAFADINPFNSIKEKWGEFQGWLGKRWDDVRAAGSDAFSHIFAGIGGGGNAGSGMSKIIDKFKVGWAKVSDWFSKNVAKPIGKIWALLWPSIHEFLVNAGHGIHELVKQITPELHKWGQVFKDMGPAIRGFWNVAKPILGLLMAAFGMIAKIVLSVAAKAIYPILQTIGNVLENLLQMVRGVLQIIEGFFMLFTSDWKRGLKLMAEGVWNIISGMFGAVGQLIRGAVKIIWGLIWGLVKGVFDFFKWLFDKLIGHSIIPDIINGIFHWFKKLIDLPKWVWDHVLKPVFDKVHDLWTKYVQPALALWWSGIQKEWKVLWTVGKWLWDHMLQPVFTYVKQLWSNTRGELSSWWERIKSVWDTLTGLGAWFKTNVMDKVFNAVTGVWDHIKSFLVSNKNMLVGPMRSIVNTIIGAVDTIISGLNKISDVLPGPINWHIDPIDKFASGGLMGRKANRGFRTNGARAIVGEGKQNYPEFVIPTDPTYRNRARGLMAQAMAKMGLNSGVQLLGAWGDTQKDMQNVARSHPGYVENALPAFGIGGWLSSNFHKATGWFKGKAKDLIATIANPALNKAQDIVMSAGWDAVKPPPLYGITRVRDWINDVNGEYKSAYETAQDKLTGGPRIRKAQAWAKSQVGKPYVWGGVGPGGYDCSGFQSAITNVLLGLPPHRRLGNTGTFPWAMFDNGIAKNGYTIGSTKSYAGGVGHMAGTLGGMNVESRGGVGVIVGSKARGYMDSGFNQRGYLPMKQGGIALASRGPTLAALGDGRYDEAVIPLQRGWRKDLIGSKGGDTVININGDLSFPNITSGDDAKTFIENLEALAKD